MLEEFGWSLGRQCELLRIIQEVSVEQGGKVEDVAMNLDCLLLLEWDGQRSPHWARPTWRKCGWQKSQEEGPNSPSAPPTQLLLLLKGGV